MKIISIITVTFNAENTLKRCIESVLPHLSDKVELIVIDGNSTDSTVQIINDYMKYISYWSSESDTGIYDAWNKGLRAAKGQYLAFLGADDVLLNNYSSAYLLAIKLNPEVEFFSSKVRMMNKRRSLMGGAFVWKKFVRYMNVAHPGALHKRSLYNTFGYYDVSFKIAGDYDFLLRCGSSLKTYFLDTVTVSMGAGGVSNLNPFLSISEARKAKLKNNVQRVILVNIEFLLAFIKIIIRRVLF
jgi:glycosyltransferase involved in cell wall biosynthesis